jgi:hypothetical protein
MRRRIGEGGSSVSQDFGQPTAHEQEFTRPLPRRRYCLIFRCLGPM